MSALLDTGLSAQQLADCAEHDRAAAHYSTLAEQAQKAKREEIARAVHFEGGSVSLQPLGDTQALVSYTLDDGLACIDGVYLAGEFVDSTYFAPRTLEMWKLAIEREEDSNDYRRD